MGREEVCGKQAEHPGGAEQRGPHQAPACGLHSLHQEEPLTNYLINSQKDSSDCCSEDGQAGVRVENK